jgi:hypothetical protein
MEEILADRGYVDRVASMRMQQEADLVVVVTWNTPEDVGVMPGKLFECFLMRKPVVGVVNGTLAGSEIREVVARVDGGFVYESAADAPEAEFDALCGFLRAHLRARREGAPAAPYGEAIEEYSYGSIAARLGQLI